VKGNGAFVYGVKSFATDFDITYGNSKPFFYKHFDLIFSEKNDGLRRKKALAAFSFWGILLFFLSR